MDAIDQDVKVLGKLLNSDVFLKKYPIIDRVFVYQFVNRIDIVMTVNDNDAYWKQHGYIESYIWDIAKMADVKSRFKIFP